MYKIIYFIIVAVLLLTAASCKTTGVTNSDTNRQASMVASSGSMSKEDNLKFRGITDRFANGDSITNDEVHWAASLVRSRTVISSEQDIVLFLEVAGVLSRAAKMPADMKDDYMRIGGLMTEFDNPPSSVRALGIKVLSKTGDDSVIDKIKPFLSDKDAFVREKAVEASKNLGVTLTNQ